DPNPALRHLLLQLPSRLLLGRVAEGHVVSLVGQPQDGSAPDTSGPASDQCRGRCFLSHSLTPITLFVTRTPAQLGGWTQRHDHASDLGDVPTTDTALPLDDDRLAQSTGDVHVVLHDIAGTDPAGEPDIGDPAEQHHLPR